MIVGFGFISEDLRRKYSTSTDPLVAEVANMGHGMSRHNGYAGEGFENKIGFHFYLNLSFIVLNSSNLVL